MAIHILLVFCPKANKTVSCHLKPTACSLACGASRYSDYKPESFKLCQSHTKSMFAVHLEVAHYMNLICDDACWLCCLYRRAQAAGGCTGSALPSGCLPQRHPNKFSPPQMHNCLVANDGMCAHLCCQHLLLHHTQLHVLHAKQESPPKWCWRGGATSQARQHARWCLGIGLATATFLACSPCMKSAST